MFGDLPADAVDSSSGAAAAFCWWDFPTLSTSQEQVQTAGRKPARRGLFC